jgi:hypothetical protein
MAEVTRRPPFYNLETQLVCLYKVIEFLPLKDQGVVHETAKIFHGVRFNVILQNNPLAAAIYATRGQRDPKVSTVLEERSPHGGPLPPKLVECSRVESFIQAAPRQTELTLVDEEEFRTGLTQDELLQLFPKAEDDFVRFPKVTKFRLCMPKPDCLRRGEARRGAAPRALKPYFPVSFYADVGKHCPEVTHLEVYNFPYEHLPLFLQSFPKIVTLVIDGDIMEKCDFTPELGTALKILKFLKNVFVRGYFTKDYYQTAAKIFSEVQCLRQFKAYDPSDEHLIPLIQATQKTLKSLKISGGKFEGAAFECLKDCQNLQELEISGSTILCGKAPSIFSQLKLSKITVQSDDDILKNLPASIATVVINYISGSAFSILNRLANLTHLTIVDTSFTNDTDLLSLQSKSLTSLTINSTKSTKGFTTDGIIKFIQQTPTLKYLDISQAHLLNAKVIKEASKKMERNIGVLGSSFEKFKQVEVAFEKNEKDKMKLFDELSETEKSDFYKYIEQHFMRRKMSFHELNSTYKGKLAEMMFRTYPFIKIGNLHHYWQWQAIIDYIEFKQKPKSLFA